MRTLALLACLPLVAFVQDAPGPEPPKTPLEPKRARMFEVEVFLLNGLGSAEKDALPTASAVTSSEFEEHVKNALTMRPALVHVRLDRVESGKTFQLESRSTRGYVKDFDLHGRRSTWDITRVILDTVEYGIDIRVTPRTVLGQAGTAVDVDIHLATLMRPILEFEQKLSSEAKIAWLVPSIVESRWSRQGYGLRGAKTAFVVRNLRYRETIRPGEAMPPDVEVWCRITPVPAGVALDTPVRPAFWGWARPARAAGGSGGAHKQR